MTRFDTHAHVFKVGLPLAAVCRYVPDYDATPEDYIKQLDKHGMTNGILIQPSFLGTNNDYMLDAIKNNNGRIYGVAVVDPGVSPDYLKKLAANHIIGIRQNLVGKPIPDFTANGWPELLKEVKALNWHVEIHHSSEDMDLIIAPLLKAGVKVVVDHFGKPNPDDPLNDAGFKYLLSIASTGRVWIKISASYRVGGREKGEKAAKIMIPTLLKAYGPKRLLWGSDWPHTKNETIIDYDGAYQAFLDLVPDENIQKVILDDAVRELIEKA